MFCQFIFCHFCALQSQVDGEGLSSQVSERYPACTCLYMEDNEHTRTHILPNRFPDLKVDVEEELKQCRVSQSPSLPPVSHWSPSLPSVIGLPPIQEYVEQVRPMVRDTVCYLHHAIQEGKKVIVEGANATMLDIDFGESHTHTHTHTHTSVPL